MKKRLNKKFKKLYAFGVCAAMLLSCVACGNDGESVGSIGHSGNVSQNVTESGPAPTEAPPATQTQNTEAPPATTEAPPATTEAPPATTEAPPATTEQTTEQAAGFEVEKVGNKYYEMYIPKGWSLSVSNVNSADFMCEIVNPNNPNQRIQFFGSLAPSARSYAMKETWQQVDPNFWGKAPVLLEPTAEAFFGIWGDCVNFQLDILGYQQFYTLNDIQVVDSGITNDRLHNLDQTFTDSCALAGATTGDGSAVGVYLATSIGGVDITGLDSWYIYNTYMVICPEQNLDELQAMVACALSIIPKSDNEGVEAVDIQGEKIEGSSYIPPTEDMTEAPEVNIDALTK